MDHHTITAAALIPAPAPQVYAVFADYHDAHPRILPKPPFVGLDVEHGGIGAGTIIHLHSQVLGRRQTIRGTVTEPEPGRVLVETYNNGIVTTFTVEPWNQGEHSYVTITTVMGVRSGIVGAAERWFSTRLLRPTFIRELANLAVIVAQPHATPGAGSRGGSGHTSST